MEVILLGGLIRATQAMASATPTILIGCSSLQCFVTTLAQKITRRLFGGETLRSLPQSWFLGMLLPVCSIGVLPIVS